MSADGVRTEKSSRVRKLSGAWTIEIFENVILGRLFRGCRGVEIEGAWIRFRTKDGILMHANGTVILKGEK